MYVLKIVRVYIQIKCLSFSLTFRGNRSGNFERLEIVCVSVIVVGNSLMSMCLSAHIVYVYSKERKKKKHRFYTNYLNISIVCSSFGTP